MLLIDIFVRVPSLTLSALLLILLVRDARQYYQAWIVIGILIASIASSLHTMPEELGLPEPIYVIALFVSVPGAALTWWFARSVLEDRFRPKLFDWGVMSTACLFKLGWSLQGIDIEPPAHEFRYIGSYSVGLFMKAHIIWIALTGLQTDLVEPRRRVRYWFIFLVALTGSANLIIELAGYSGAAEAIFIHATTLPMLLWAVIWLSQLAPARLFFDANQPAKNAMINIPERMVPAFQNLIRIIETDQGYTDQHLTIGKLAKQIGLPEHQLRRLINQSLGHRNFATYLNTFRLAHAKTALADPDRAQLPILTIAMDAGYKTLSTFNRAFKAAENETPSDYRRRALRAALPT